MWEHHRICVDFPAWAGRSVRYQRTIDYCSALAARPAPPSSLIHQWSRQARPRIPAQCSAAVPHLPPGLYSSYWDRGSIVRQGRTSGPPGVCWAGCPQSLARCDQQCFVLTLSRPYCGSGHIGNSVLIFRSGWQQCSPDIAVHPTPHSSLLGFF